MTLDTTVRLHWDALLKLALYLTLDATEADDLMQDSLERMVASWPTFDGVNFNGWARTIMRNAHINNVRRRSMIGRRLGRPVDPLDVDIPGYDLEAAADARAALCGPLMRMPGNKRRMLIEAAIGRSLDDMAGNHRVPTGTVKSTLSRARAELRGEIA